MSYLHKLVGCCRPVNCTFSEYPVYLLDRGLVVKHLTEEDVDLSIFGNLHSKRTLSPIKLVRLQIHIGRGGFFTLLHGRSGSLVLDRIIGQFKSNIVLFTGGSFSFPGSFRVLLVQESKQRKPPQKSEALLQRLRCRFGEKENTFSCTRINGTFVQLGRCFREQLESPVSRWIAMKCHVSVLDPLLQFCKSSWALVVSSSGLIYKGFPPFCFSHFVK